MLKLLYNKNILEIAITYRCNLNCNNCGTLCTQAPTEFYDMSIGHFVKIFYDCKKNSHKFKEIRITGGEPVFHRNIKGFYAFVKNVLNDYRYNFKDVTWLTNYSNEYVRMMIEKIKGDGFNIGSSEKSDTKKYDYVTVNSSPCDTGCKFRPDGCNISKDCGIAYNINGYFPCTPMAAASRVFKDIKGVSSIAELTEDKIQKMFNLHCKRCGHSRLTEERNNLQIMSKTWEIALNEYCIHNSIRQP